jgi:hypothetical protein
MRPHERVAQTHEHAATVGAFERRSKPEQEKQMKAFAACIACAIAFAIAAAPAFAQNGTPHGVNLAWNASTTNTNGATDTIVSYNIYRCPGTCALASANWTKIDAMPDLTTGYLDQSTLTPGAAYSYAATAVDSNGNESAFGNIATVTLPSTPPANPTAPAGLAAKQQ